MGLLLRFWRRVRLAVVRAHEDVALFRSLTDSGQLFCARFYPMDFARSPGYFAPAVVILLMDLLLKGSANTLEGGLALLIVYLGLVMAVAVYAFLRRRKRPQESLNEDSLDDGSKPI